MSFWCPRCRVTDACWRLVKVLPDGRRVAPEVDEYKHRCGYHVYAERAAVAV